MGGIITIGFLAKRQSLNNTSRPFASIVDQSNCSGQIEAYLNSMIVLNQQLHEMYGMVNSGTMSKVSRHNFARGSQSALVSSD